MIAYKGFQKDLKCRGFQFQEYGINETEKANCRQNGFHCAENPLDCLCYYPNWKNSVYYIVDASGDLDEDGEDSKISCTKMRLLKKIELRSLLLHGAAYMSKYPNRHYLSTVYANHRIKIKPVFPRCTIIPVAPKHPKHRRLSLPSATCGEAERR